MKSNNNVQHPQPRQGILDIAAYVPGSNQAASGVKTYKLSANESSLGPCARALDAYRQASGHLEIYPDGNSTPLLEAIAEMTGLNFNHLMAGNGSDDLLGLISNTYLAAGDEGIMTEHGFNVYEIQIRGTGAKPIIVKEKDCRIDIDAIHGAVTDKTKIVFIANPGNPTGTYLSFDEIKRLHAGLPKSVLLVLDGAYAEFVTENDFEAGVELVSNNENVIMTRTFSKIYGLAALRIGWMYAPLHVIDAVNRIRGAFNVSAPAQAAGAAAIRDRDYLSNAIQYHAKWRHWLSDELSALGLKVTPSVTNFILVHFPNDAKKSAHLADEYLKQHGYIVRRVTNYGFPNALRISIGTQEANHGIVATLKEFLK